VLNAVLMSTICQIPELRNVKMNNFIAGQK